VFSHLIAFHDPHLSTHLDSIGFIPDVRFLGVILLINLPVICSVILLVSKLHCYSVVNLCLFIWNTAMVVLFTDRMPFFLSSQ